MKAASGTSLFIIAVNSLIGFAGDALITKMDWTFLLVFTTIAIVGVLAGNQLSSAFRVSFFEKPSVRLLC